MSGSRDADRRRRVADALVEIDMIDRLNISPSVQIIMDALAEDFERADRYDDLCD